MSIRKELKLLSDKLKSEGHPNYHNEACKQMNDKYGKDWRTKDSFKAISTNIVKMDYF